MINKKGITSVSFALMLVISTFAFAYMIGSEMRAVSALEFFDESSQTVVNENGEYIRDASRSDFSLSIYTGQNTVQQSTTTDVQGIKTQVVGSSIQTQVVGSTAPTPVATPTIIQGSSNKNIDTTTIKSVGNYWYANVPGENYLAEYNPSTNQWEKSYLDKSIYTENGKDVKFTEFTESTRPTSNTGTNNVNKPAATTSVNTGDESIGSAGDFGKIYPWGGLGYLAQGVVWAGVAGGLVLTLGGMFIKDKENLNAAAAGIAAGVLVGRGIVGGLFAKGGVFGGGEYSAGNWKWGQDYLGSVYGQAIIGAATAWMVYNAMWSSEKVSVETVTFNCLPWQAPNGGTDCELCNDENLPCSEYRCKSLGQSCEIVNKGTKEERCVNVNPRDSSPPVITPNNADLSSGFQYFDVKDMPPSPGFSIRSTSTSTGCLPAYTPIQFGITTNEPSQCKIDIAPKGNYSQMVTFMNGDNMYKYNHSEFLNLPSSADIKNSSIKLQNGKELIFYIRCKDAAGNTNEADYALKICVDPSPDNTAPVVQGTSIQNKGCVPADAENATVEFYINEPSECRWDYYDKDYDQMGNNMLCSTSAIEINAIQSYTCFTQLKGIARDGNNFFVRCKDQPEGVNESKRNKMQESYIFNLRRSNQLKLNNLKPNETIFGAIRPAPVELYAETLFGCEDNKAICYYSTTNNPNSFVQFFDNSEGTNEGIHTQRLDLNDGTYTYYVRCVDGGGNVVNATTQFKVSIDTNAPVVARAYEEDGYLKLVTPLNSECVYNTESCDYLFSEGTQMPYANSTAHVTEWFADKKYFIKCRDQYRSEPVDCSLIVRPTENFLGE